MTVPRCWIPNPARWVRLFAYAGGAPRGYYPAPLPRRWQDKSATDSLDYGLDCRPFLARAGDAVASFACAVDPPGLALEAAVNIGDVLIAWLSGGTPGTEHTVTWTIRTRTGQLIVAPVAVAVSAALPLDPAPLPTLTVRGSGAPLQMQGPAPLLVANGALSRAAATHDGAVIETRGGALVFR